MSATVLYMSMSLDGFVAGPNETLENGLGDGGVNLHEWNLGLPLDQLDGADGEVTADFLSTGAIVAGRGTFEAAAGWNGDHHHGVPILILSPHPRCNLSLGGVRCSRGRPATCRDLTRKRRPVCSWRGATDGVVQASDAGAGKRRCRAGASH
jgi:hypothetical protein